MQTIGRNAGRLKRRDLQLKRGRRGQPTMTMWKKKDQDNNTTDGTAESPRAEVGQEKPGQRERDACALERKGKKNGNKLTTKLDKRARTLGPAKRQVGENEDANSSVVGTAVVKKKNRRKLYHGANKAGGGSWGEDFKGKRRGRECTVGRVECGVHVKEKLQQVQVARRTEKEIGKATANKKRFGGCRTLEFGRDTEREKKKTK